MDYIPSGYGGILAPYIETGPGTMRAAATLMLLDVVAVVGAIPTQKVICDLGCGDGEFLINLLRHINSNGVTPVHGVGVDYNAELIKTATLNALAEGEIVEWMTYDFNEDEFDLFSQLALHCVTHIFVYLVPKQLALKTVRRILTRLYKSGVMVCCHKFQPTYLEATGRDELMDLVVYSQSASGTELGEEKHELLPLILHG